MSSGLGLVPGAVFAGDYRIVRPLSSGGMGAVYVALQLSTERERALKVMLGDLVGNDDLKRRFAQEAKIGAQIQSEHVVEVVGAGIDGATGAPWLAMELLQGRDLASYMMSSGPLPVPVVLEIFEQMTHAVGAAHDKQIVHRDLKPENLFLAQTRRKGDPFILKVLDFGIAKLLGHARTSATGAMGTPLWMSSEQTQAGAQITPATDVWAMALIAFRALSGRPFWRSAGDPDATSITVLREIAIEPIPPASQRARELGAPALPEGFDAWFARCVNREPSARFPDARAMFEDLRRVLGDEPRTSGSPPRISAGSFDLGVASDRGVTERVPTPSESAQTLAAAPLVARESELPASPASTDDPRSLAPAIATPGSDLDARPIEPDLSLPKQKLPVGLLGAVALVLAAGAGIAWVVTRDAGPGKVPSGDGSAAASAEASLIPASYEELAGESKRHLRDGKLGPALDAAQSAKLLDPKRPDGYFLAALAHEQRCVKGASALPLPCADCDAVSCESCAREAGKASERGGTSQALYRRGRCVAVLGRHEESLKDLDAAVSHSPKSADYRVDRAAVLLAMGRRSDACTDLEVAVELGAEAPPKLTKACEGAGSESVAAPR
jgi:serine/threonine protein kinase